MPITGPQLRDARNDLRTAVDILGQAMGADEVDREKLVGRAVKAIASASRVLKQD